MRLRKTFDCPVLIKTKIIKTSNMTTLTTTLISLRHVDTDEKQNKKTRNSSPATPKVLSMILYLTTTHPDAN